MRPPSPRSRFIATRGRRARRRGAPTTAPVAQLRAEAWLHLDDHRARRAASISTERTGAGVASRARRCVHHAPARAVARRPRKGGDGEVGGGWRRGRRRTRRRARALWQSDCGRRDGCHTTAGEPSTPATEARGVGGSSADGRANGGRGSSSEMKTMAALRASSSAALIDAQPTARTVARRWRAGVDGGRRRSRTPPPPRRGGGSTKLDAWTAPREGRRRLARVDAVAGERPPPRESPPPASRHPLAHPRAGDTASRRTSSRPVST